MAVLLVYNLSGERYQKLRLTAMRFRIRLRPVRPEEYAETLAALCGTEPLAGTPFTGDGFDDEMLVMADFPTGLAQQFLSGLKRMNAPHVALKAVLTSTNRAWNSVRLNKELSGERAALEAGGKRHEG